MHNIMQKIIIALFEKKNNLMIQNLNERLKSKCFFALWNQIGCRFGALKHFV